MNEAICLIAAMLCHLEVIIIVETSHFTTTRIITRNTSFIALCYVLLHILPCFLWLTRTSEWDGKMVCERFVLLFYALIREHSVYLFFFILFFQMIHKIAFQNFTRVSERKIDARWKKKLVHYLYESWRGKFLLSFSFFDIVAYVWTAARREKTCE